MVTISCTGQSEARGRNRWFRLAEAELTLFHHGHAELPLISQASPPPVLPLEVECCKRLH